MNIESYEINKDTCAIINLGGTASQILEKKNEYLIPRTTYKIMEDSCAYYGSTFDGRLKGTKMILGSNYKLPIIIKDSDMIFFPTTGCENEKCSWISLQHIEKYEPYKGFTKVQFYQGRTIILKMSCTSFENQLLRALRLHKLLKERYDANKPEEPTKRVRRVSQLKLDDEDPLKPM